jgi:hypothetical protein
VQKTKHIAVCCIVKLKRLAELDAVETSLAAAPAKFNRSRTYL